MSKIAYATKVENGGTTAEGRISADDANEIKTSVNALYDEVPYKSYVALISQTGTSAPTAIILQNTTGLTFTTSRDGAGFYKITPNTSPSVSKCTLITGSLNGAVYAVYEGAYIDLRSYDTEAGTGADGVLTKLAVEFRIYP